MTLATGSAAEAWRLRGGAVTVRLAPDADAPRRARAEVRTTCKGHSVAVLAEDAALVAAELVARALRGGPRAVVLSLDLRADAVVIRVEQAAAAAGRPGPQQAVTGTDWGLVPRLAAAHGCSYDVDGLRLWAELRRGRSRPAASDETWERYFPLPAAG